MIHVRSTTHRGAVRLALLLLLGVARPVAAQGTPSAAQMAASDTKVRAAAAFVDRTWAEIFRANGERYVSPRLVPFLDSIRTGCGVASSGNAYACPNDGVLYYDRAFLASLMGMASRTLGTDGDMAAIFPILHEWGHAVQFMLQLDYSRASLRSEPDADCLAGAVVARANTDGYLQPGDLAETEWVLKMGGDGPLVTGDWERALDQINATAAPERRLSNVFGNHGNAQDRVAAFHRGERGGAAACVAGIPRRGAPPAASTVAPAPSASTIRWYANNVADAYDLAVAQNKPLILLVGDAGAPNYESFRRELMASPAIAALAPYAIFAYANTGHDIVAQNIAKALRYDRYPIVSLLAPNGHMLDEVFRVVGYFSGDLVASKLSERMRQHGWLGAPLPTPWLPPRPGRP